MFDVVDGRCTSRLHLILTRCLTHAARAAAKQLYNFKAPLVAARGAREGSGQSNTARAAALQLNKMPFHFSGTCLTL